LPRAIVSESNVTPILEIAPLDDPALREALKRCPPDTYYAACQFRRTGDGAHVAPILRGIVERHVERPLRPQLRTADPALRLREDLGLDSLTMMEIVMLAEEVFTLSISNEELTQLRTLGDVQRFFETKVRGPVGTPPSLPAPPLAVWELRAIDASIARLSTGTARSDAQSS
jgi:3-hydroxyacyl-[acyl-carrier-protein] dehydratase